MYSNIESLINNLFLFQYFQHSFSINSVYPMIAFIGVRISCDILNKKRDLAALASCAFFSLHLNLVAYSKFFFMTNLKLSNGCRHKKVDHNTCLQLNSSFLFVDPTIFGNDFKIPIIIRKCTFHQQCI